MNNDKDSKPSSILIKPDGKIQMRSVSLSVICLVLASALVLRLFYLQVIKNNYYENKVIEQMVYETSISAPRGNILDRNGRVIATSYKTERLYMSPSAIKSEDDRIKICEYFSELLDINYDTIYTNSKKTTQKEVVIKTNIEEETADVIRKFIIDNSYGNILFLSEMNTRVYPYQTLASNVIGFCGTDGGLYGLEYVYNDVLAGISGKIVSAERVDGEDMPYSYETYIDAENGANLVTTIEFYIQSCLEKYLEEAAVEAGCESRACGIAMNPKTGEIYGMAVYPSYDLNNPYDVVDYYADELEKVKEEYGIDSSEYLSHLRNYQLLQWNNKCISETYEPGSTSKIFTTSMALEENLATTSEKFTCTGSHVVSGWTIRCHKKGGHGTLSFAEGLQMSCNPVMMKLSQRIGADKFYKYFEAFGLLEKTGIDLVGEAETIIKEEENAKELDLAVYSFGQRYNVTTLMQLTAVSAVANNGTLVTPHLIKEIVDDDGAVLFKYETNEVRQVISEETAQTISKILAEGVSGNGGARNAYVEGYSIAAKTGTSEKGTVGNKRIVSTVAYAPSDDAEISVIMMIDEPTKGLIYGSQLVAPYISKFLADVLPYLGIEPELDESKQSDMFTVKNYRGMSLDAAKSTLDENGIKYEIIGNGESVLNQVPISESIISKKEGKVILYTSDSVEASTSTVPNVIGMTAEQANIALVNAGFNVQIDGRTAEGTTVAVQSIEPNSTAPIGTIVKITMRFCNDTE